MLVKEAKMCIPLPLIMYTRACFLSLLEWAQSVIGQPQDRLLQCLSLLLAEHRLAGAQKAILGIRPRKMANWSKEWTTKLRKPGDFQGWCSVRTGIFKICIWAWYLQYVMHPMDYARVSFRYILRVLPPSFRVTSLAMRSQIRLSYCQWRSPRGFG